MEKLHTYVLWSDAQAPFQDTPVVELILSFINALKPQGCWWVGDITDSYGLGKYPRDPRISHTFADEIALTTAWMTRLRDVPDKRWLLGNHEARIANKIAHLVPELGTLPGVQFDAIFHTADHGFQVHPYKEVVHLGKLAVTHGHHVRRQAGASVLAHIAQYGQSTAIGHTHRAAAVYETDLNGCHMGLELGCTCRLDGLGYAPNPNWTQAFAVIEVDPKTGWFIPTLIPVLRKAGKPCFWFEGELVEVKRAKKSQP